MRTLFLDLSFGVAGDMLISSLLCHLERDSIFVDAMNGLFKDEQTKMLVTDKTDYSLSGKSFEIICESNLQPRYLNDIIKIIEGKSLSKNVKEKSISAFRHLAKVEGNIHGKSPEEIHFHEIGAMDTIVDIVGFYYLLELLNIDKVLATPVNVGKGMIKIAHGTLPVPAPAT
ncbi:MAG: DUF111 family protein, partial [Clostridia bacterium]|nr:DUF111 family protein [Clostridia bacterium]